jgi:hypothetical protein
MDKEEGKERIVAGLRSINYFSLDEPKLFRFFLLTIPSLRLLYPPELLSAYSALVI